MTLTARTLTHLILTSLLVVLTATFSFAHQGPGRGHGSGGYGCDGYMQSELTTEDQNQLTELKGSYADRFAELESALDGKRDSYREARANPDTRVAELDQLHSEINALHEQYRSLKQEYRDQVHEIIPARAGSCEGQRNCANNTPARSEACGGQRNCANYASNHERGLGNCNGPGPKKGRGMHHGMRGGCGW